MSTLTTISQQPPRTWRRRTGYWWFALTAVAVVAFAVTPYLISSLPALARGNVGLSRNYVNRGPFITTALYVHVACAGLALVLSPLQFAAGLRNRVPRVHRITGRIVLTAIFVGGPAGIVLSTASLAGPLGTAAFGTLGVLWLTFAVKAFRAIRHGDIVRHRRWMIRTFSLTYAGVMLRLLMPIMVAIQTAAFGVAGDAAWDRAYHVVVFLCWVPNLLVAEWFLSRDTASRPSAPGSSRET